MCIIKSVKKVRKKRGEFMWYLYILRCCDNSLYTGITTDWERRFHQHSSGKGAKYTRSRGVLSVEFVIPYETRSEAAQKEWAVKKLTKSQKEELIETSKKIIL